MRNAERALPEMERLTARSKSVGGRRSIVGQSSQTFSWWQRVLAAWHRLLSLTQVRSSERRLRFVERIPLGDKQFVALLEIDGASFLASGSQGGAVTLTPALSPKYEKAKPAKRAANKPKNIVEASIQDDRSKQQVSDFKQLPATKARAATVKRTQVEPGAEPKGARVRTKTSAANTGVEAANTKPQAPRRRIPEQINSAPRRSAAKVTANADNQTIAGTRKHAAAKSIAASVPKTGAHHENVLLKHEPTISQVAPAIANSLTTPYKGLNVSPEKAPLPDSPEPEQEAESISPFQDFAALLELRMLATEVFEQRDAEEAITIPDDAMPVDRVRLQGSISRDRKHRVRNALSSSACFLLMLLVPFSLAHASVPQMRVASSSVSQSILPAHMESLSGMFVSPIVPSVLAFAAHAGTPAPASDEIRVSGLNGLGGSSASWGIVVLLTLLTLIPSLLLCVTPFARLLIVFHFLRQALGLQTTPSNQTLIGLSLILTFFIMQPVGAVIYRDSVLPVQAGKLTPLDGVVRAGEPMRHFMAHYVREKDAELFLEIAKEPRPHSVDELSIRVMLPAYILSELKAGFQIGTVLFLPFLIVDMVVASITTSVGMVQLPPVVISTPLKLLLFLMVDGWHLLIGALMRSFN